MKKALIFFLVIIISCIAIGVKHIIEIENLTNNINGTLYYNDYSNGSEAYSLNLQTYKEEKINLNKGYDILDYTIIPDGYCCIAREIQSDNNFNSFCLYHVNNIDKKIVIPKTSGKLSIADNGVFFFSDYFSTANSFTLSYLDFDSASINDIKQNITDYCIMDNTIYFINNNDLYEKDLCTEDENLIIKSCSQIIKANKHFAFIKTDSGIYKYYFDTKSIEKYSSKNNYKLITAINDEGIVITKQGNSKEHDELEYNIFEKNLKSKYYILSDNKLIHLKRLDGYNIENAIYYDKNLEE